MAKKYFNPLVIGAVLVSIVFLYSINVMALGEEKKEERTYQTDRTLIKEVIANQKQTHALLSEIKGLLKDAMQE